MLNTMTIHSFHYSHFRVALIYILNVKSHVQADPSRHCLHTTERRFSCRTRYERMFRRAPQADIHVETLKQH